jgi:hypothetical protein
MGVGLAATVFAGEAFARLRTVARLVGAATATATPFVTEPAWSPSDVTIDAPASATASWSLRADDPRQHR